MNILVTGGLGFVGVNLVRYLARSLPDATVVAADLGMPDALTHAFWAPVAARVRAVPLDVTDRAAVLELVRRHAITHVVHAAAITPGLEQERRAPTVVVDVNLFGTVNLLEATIAAPTVERTIVLSSSGLYGAPTQAEPAPEHEDGPLELDNLYAITKRSGELLGARYAALSGKPIVAARLAAPYGPLERPTGSRSNMGQLQRLTHALLDGRPVAVAGPEIVRDWTYVDDTAAAILALLRLESPAHSVYNVSAGQPLRFASVVAAFERHGLMARWVDDADGAEIAMRSQQQRAPLDIGRLRAETGFAPRYDLDAGVAAYLAAEAALRDAEGAARSTGLLQ